MADRANIKQLEHWLDAQDHRMARAVATRACLRSLPALMPLADRTVAGISGATVLLSGFRTALVSGVLCTCDPADRRDVEDATADTTRYAANSTRFLSRTLRGEDGAPGAAAALNAAEYAASLTGVDKPAALSAVRHCGDAAHAVVDYALTATTGIGPPDGPQDAARERSLTAAIGDALQEPGLSPSAVFARPLWPRPDMVPELTALSQDFIEWFETDAAWAFWVAWYQALLAGHPMDWSLQLQIARIDPEIWDAGASAVAEKIAEIQQGFEPDAPLPPESTRRQAQVLLRSAVASETAARGLQQLIRTALDAYLREISNALPEALDPLDHLPPILNDIAELLARETPRAGDEDDLARLVSAMAQVIATLNARLVAVHGELAMAREQPDDPAPHRLFADAFYKKAGEGAAALITSKVLWGGLISGSALLMGADAEALTKGIGDCFQTIILPESSGAMTLEPRAVWQRSVDI